MTQTGIGLLLLFLHLIVSAVVWFGIRTGVLKVKMYLMFLVLFVPFWGVLCVLFLHTQICAGADNVRQADVEKLKVNEERYKNIFVSQETKEQVVPLEDALLLNEAGVRRELIMDVLNDNPGEYMELLKKARMNDDVEVVHYAITAMVELSKDYDYRLQQLEKRYARHPEDPAILAEYCDFLEEYLDQGILEAQMEQMQRRQYIQLLQKRKKQRAELHTSILLTENLLKLKAYGEAYEELQFMREHWYRREEYWILYVKYCAEQKQGRALAQALSEMKREHIYLSSKGKEALALWLDT
ncbi:MAG: hypothetical protein PUA72_06430 [Lachnospiraceae bacterium]|nr:hypothetical protein [Lachnospiraceae bacterium]